MFDDVEVDKEGRLVIRCDDVPEEFANLARPECLRAVLRHLLEEPNVRGVVLVHDREKAYGARAMAVLRRLVAAARLLDQFASRPPAPNFPGFAAKEVEALCAKCEFRPAVMYPKLREALLRDPADLVNALEGLAASLAKYEEEGCAVCIGGTVQDLRILVEELERLEG